MNNKYRHNGRLVDAAEALDETGTLRDGFSVFVPMRLRDQDSARRAIERNGLHDGRGNMPGNRPGYVIDESNVDANDERAAAYIQYERELVSAYKTDGRKIVQRDPAGRLMSTLEEEDDDERLLDASTRTIDALQKDHAERMRAIYQQRDEELRNAWRSPR